MINFQDQAFYESKNRAIQEAIQLNTALREYKWQTVSMAMNGQWYADECTARDMVANHSHRHYEAKFGFDTTLHEVFAESPMQYWIYSVGIVPSIGTQGDL